MSSRFSSVLFNTFGIVRLVTEKWIYQNNNHHRCDKASYPLLVGWSRVLGSKLECAACLKWLLPSKESFNSPDRSSEVSLLFDCDEITQFKHLLVLGINCAID
jgi:hypothetical protein